MTYKYYKNGQKMTAVNSANGYIMVDKILESHAVCVGVDKVICQEATQFETEITKEEFFDYINYPLAVIDGAVKFFQKGDPEYEATSKAATERRAVYVEQKSKQYH